MGAGRRTPAKAKNNWGENRRLLFSLATWYSYELTQAQLQSFPSNTKLIMQVYDDDNVNDHRMAIGIFNNIYIGLKTVSVSVFG